MNDKMKTREAELTIEEVKGCDEDKKSACVRVSVSSEVEYLTEVYDAEKEKWVRGYEVLGHGDGEIDFTRIKDGLVIQDTHHGDQVGLIRTPEVKDGKLGGVIEFCAGSRAKEICEDAVKGLRRNMSVGYFVNEYRKMGEKDGVPVFRAVRWTPYEASFVNVPADTNVGVGRSLNNNGEEVTPRANSERKVSNMEAEVQKPEAVGVTAEMVRSIIKDELSAIKPQMPEPKAARQFDEAETKVIKRSYNICNAIRALAGEKVDVGFERELSDEIAKQTGRSAQGLFVPDCALRTLSTDTFSKNADGESNGAKVVATDLLTGSFIDALVAKTVFGQLGVQTLTGLVGDIAIPKGGAASASWQSAENADIGGTNPQMGQVLGTPHTLGAYCDITRKLLNQAAISAQGFVTNAITSAIGRGIESAGFSGNGSSGAPTGLESTSGVQSISLTAGAVNKGELVDFWKAIYTENAEGANMKFVGSPAVKALLAKTLDYTAITASGTNVGGVTSGKYLVEGDMCEGYPFVMSNLCAAKKLYFGDWSQLVLAFWSGLDLTVDPYTLAKSGAIRVVALQDCDVLVRQPKAFAIGTALS